MLESLTWEVCGVVAIASNEAEGITNEIQTNRQTGMARRPNYLGAILL